MGVSLNSLPDDVLLLILSRPELEVRDVLAVRQTCRHLCLLSYDLSLWVTLLYRLSKVFSLPATPPPPGPRQQSGLEYIARRTLSLAANLSQPDGPLPTEVIVIKGDHAARDVAQLELVDEGRWLLVLTNTDLSLYDLRSPLGRNMDAVGGPSDEDVRLQNTTRRKKGIFREAILWATTRCGWSRDPYYGLAYHLQESDLYILMSSGAEVQLLYISLAHEPSTFDHRWTAKRAYQQPPAAMALNATHAVFPDSETSLIVVNYRTGVHGVLELQDAEPEEDDSSSSPPGDWPQAHDVLALQLFPKHILVLQTESMCFFPLPPLQPDSGLFSEPGVTVKLPSEVPEEPRSEYVPPNSVWNFPSLVKGAVFSSPYSWPRRWLPTDHSAGHIDEKVTDAEEIQYRPLEVLLTESGDVAWSQRRLWHYRLQVCPGAKPVESSCEPQGPEPDPPYLLPGTLVQELDAAVELYWDTHDSFAISPSGKRAILLTTTGPVTYDRRWEATKADLPPDWSQLQQEERASVRTESLHHNPVSARFEQLDLMENTPLRRMTNGNGVSVDDISGRVAVAERDGSVWVFGFV